MGVYSENPRCFLTGVREFTGAEGRLRRRGGHGGKGRRRGEESGEESGELHITGIVYLFLMVIEIKIEK